MDFSFIDIIFDPLTRKKARRWVLELPGAGCEWYKESGGCTMCAFGQSTQDYTFGGRLYPNFMFMLLFRYAYSFVKKLEPELLYIYNGGSFLSDKEIPAKTQLAIMKFVAKHPTIGKILVESRADLVTAEKLALYKKAVGSKQVQIALGLESANDQVRNGCLKKGLPKKAFEQAIKLCHDQGFPVFAYVFLKPHCLDEKAAIEDAVESIKYCFSVGVDEVSLSCAFVQRGTILEELYDKGEYLPPTLWSVIEVIQRTASLGPVRIGLFDDDPPPIAIPQNCTKCTKQVMSAISDYRSSHDISVFKELTCECKNS
ncbi:radical SAM protein [Patescibacteria group bacterium]